MITALKIVIGILLVFTALGVLCAVRIGLRRDTRKPDPFSRAFGEMPLFTAEQLNRLPPPRSYGDPLRRSFVTCEPLVRLQYGRGCTSRDASDLWNSAGALRTEADVGRPIIPSWPAAIGNYLSGGV